jgi:hypothetical protein
MIPVAGTIAALIAIALAREPRGEAPEPTQVDRPTAPEHDEELLPEEPEPPEDAPLPPPPQAEPQEYQLELNADGTITDVEELDEFASVDDLQQKLGDARHRLVLTNGAGVDEAALDAAFTKLRDAKLANGDPRFQVRKVYRVPDAPKGD